MMAVEAHSLHLHHGPPLHQVSLGAEEAMGGGEAGRKDGAMLGPAASN
jgi:hypothetical protein